MKGNKTYRIRIINAGFALPFEIYIEKVIVHTPNNISIFKIRYTTTLRHAQKTKYKETPSLSFIGCQI